MENTENKILGNLLVTPVINKSLLKISSETGLSYVTVHKTVPALLKQKLVKQETKGHSNLISIDFENSSLGRLSSAIALEKFRIFNQYPLLELISNDIEEVLADFFYSLILFGSFVNGSPSKDSDVDLLLIIPERKVRDIYAKKINSLHHSIKKDIIIISSQDFNEMLEQKNTVGRAAFNAGIVLFGADHYYSLVKKYVRSN